MRDHFSHNVHVVAAAVALAVAPVPTHALDGTGAAATTYYEDLTAGAGVDTLTSAAPGLPSALHVRDAEGAVEYRQIGSSGTALEWTVRVELAERQHERVDAVYDLVLALPLPEGAGGVGAFAAKQWGIVPHEGSPNASVPIVYGGEKIILKRNVGLERAWLPSLSGAGAGLPELAGTGYRYTFWDAIIRYDPGHGDVVQGFGTLRYDTAPGVGAPDPDDVRMSAFLIVWVPSLDPAQPPYAVRIDVRPPAPQ